MHLLPARTKINKNKIDVKNEIHFFYLCIFAVLLLFFSAFCLKIYLNRKVVLGIQKDASKELMFWQEFTLQNPGYYESWVELYNLTGDNEYLNKAKVVDPNR